MKFLFGRNAVRNSRNSSLMSAPLESYTPGYSENAAAFMARRRAETHAAFFLPHLRAGMTVLDCGCGPGTITLGLAERVAPGMVTGIDSEESQVGMARENGRSAGANVRFETASVYGIPFPENSFDAAFSSALFEHLREPPRALGEIRRVLKPGGAVGLRAPDWGGFLVHPAPPEVAAAIEYYQALQSSNGGEVRAGRKLAGWLRDAGFERVAFSAAYECYPDAGLIGEYLARGIETSSEPFNWQSEFSRETLAAALREWASGRDAFFAQAWGEATGFAPVAS
jgi:ubiquinone/menaquinone biosynthesis C-methylase UbiE